MIYLNRKEQETISAFVRRFMLRVQASGVLKEAKSKKYFKKDANRNMRRVAALERNRKTTEYRKLKKLGRVK
jgi:ribosomal protein S21